MVEMKQASRMKIIAILATVFLCGCTNSSLAVEQEDTPKQDIPAPDDGTQTTPPTVTTVEWDHSSCRFVTNGGYGRIRRIGDGRLALVYSAGTMVRLRTSSDNGATWSAQSTVASGEHYNYTNAELVCLADGRLIYSWNARPREDGYEYKIMLATSDDNGVTWSSPRNIYVASSQSSEGCWEPVILELPDGELQLFFANEFPYKTTNEQEITVMRSHDRGATWSEPQCASFRAKARDGMPVPIYLPESDEVVVAIEDNGLQGRMKPAIVRTSKRWNDGTVTGNSPRRHAALAPDVRLHDTVYAGAPYLIRLHNGRTLLSVQSTEGRHGITHQYANMQVYVGDSTARNFTRRTTPFPTLPENGNTLWCSLCQINDTTVMAVMSVNGADKNGIWTVRGKLVEK